jgi:c-di-GMP-binding flagellar brake protein YcgR
MPSPPAPNNRRNYFRQPMYQRINLRVAGMRVAVPATLIDISGGGCLLHARTMLASQTEIEFDLTRPGQPALRLAGKLKKVTYTASDRTFRYAVGWNAIDEETHDQLIKFILDEQRRALNGNRKDASPDEGLSVKPKPSTRLQELRAHRRVEVNFPVLYSVQENPGNFSATAVDVSTGGMRIITEQVLRQEWIVTITFTLPNEPLRALHQHRGAATPFNEMKLMATPLPGIKHSRGRFIQSLSWLSPDPRATQEISRFIQAVQLTSHRRR